MTWNWQQKNWPNFSYNKDKLEHLENSLLYNNGVLFGAFQHLSEEDQDTIKIEILSDEALKTSEIEGEYLNRDSLQSFILKEFGLKTDNRKIPPAEKAIAELMINLYSNYNLPLSHQLLFNWHKILMGARQDLIYIGKYRQSQDPMQVISGPIHSPKVHFEAPPTTQVMSEMERFITWFNDVSPTLNLIIKAAITHLYFVCIHPFEDGNGRIARALTEKALAQSMGHPTLLAIATIIEKDRKTYYQKLQEANQTLEITNWIEYFGQIILEAQQYTQNHINFLIKKTKFYDKHKNNLNIRQSKAIIRMFRAGPKGFLGGLSAQNYIAITNTSRPTATRDLDDLVKKQILLKSGNKKYTRYSLNL